MTEIPDRRPREPAATHSDDAAGGLAVSEIATVAVSLAESVTEPVGVAAARCLRPAARTTDSGD